MQEKNPFPLEQLGAHHPSFLRKIIFFIDFEDLGKVLVSSSIFTKSLSKEDLQLLKDKFLEQKIDVLGPVEERYFVDPRGRRQGLGIRTLYQTQFFREAHYVNGVYEGLLREWWGHRKKRSTIPSMEAHYKKGKRDGKTTAWHENGAKKAEHNYKEGVPDGLWRYWHDNGVLSEEFTYQDGKKHGHFLRIDKDGEILEEGTYEEWEMV